MRAIWADPAHLIPRGLHDLRIYVLEALARAGLPPARRTVAPQSGISDLLICAQRRLAVHGGRWGMVQRDGALVTAVPALKVTTHPATKGLWDPNGACQRCIVPATGWLTDGRNGEVLAVRPEEQPVLIAGMYVETGNRSGGPPEDVEFLVLTSRYDGPAGGRDRVVPLTLPIRSYDSWLSENAGYATTFLPGPGGERNTRMDVRPVAARPGV